MVASQLDNSAVDYTRWMWAVLSFALIVRVWGCWYGLPFCYHKDEYHEVMRALELGAGGFNLERTAKGGFYLLLFFEYGMYFVLLRILGFVRSTGEFAELFARDPSAFYLMGRITAAVCGAITVAACFWLGRRAYTAAAGLLASAFIALNVLHVDLSRVIGVDVPMTMFAAVTLYFALKTAERGEPKDYWYGALFAALATTTKLPGVLVVLPLLVAHGYAAVRHGGGIRNWLGVRELWVSAAIFAVTLVATNPGILLMSDLLSLFTSNAADAVGDEVLDEVVGSAVNGRPNLFVYYLVVLQQSMGWPLLLVGLAGSGYALWKRTPADVILLTFGVTNYLAIASTTSQVLYYPRYALPIIVVLSVLAARIVAQVLCSVPKYRVAVSVAALSALAASPAIDVAINAYAVAQTDTRTLALNWIEDNVPVASRVLIEGGKIGADRGTVPLRDTRDTLRRRIEFWRSIEPRQAKFLELQLEVHRGGGYELELVRIGAMETVEQYLASGVRYFVVRPTYFIGSRRSAAPSKKFIRDLRADPRISLLESFEGDTRTRPGPTIEVYGFRDPWHDSTTRLD